MAAPFVRGAAGALLGVSLLAPPAAASPATPPGAAGLGYAQAAAAMRAAGAPYSSWAAQGRQFLAFDANGDGIAVEVIGDLTTATRVVVLVPGVGSRLDDFDRGLGGVVRRAPARQARILYAAVRATDPGTPVAVVAWLGYDAPDGLGLEAARDVRARVGAKALAAFVAAVAQHRPATTVVLIGHSYGALVVGLAAPRLGPAVTDVVALGAAGIGVDRAADLGTSARIWAALAGTDWIRRVPAVRVGRLGHGVPPSAPAFGARALPADRVRGHDGYLDTGTDTLDALVSVVRGRSAVGGL
jgi:pimeloyl-ACP methyl ester carboxylesterase